MIRRGGRCDECIVAVITVVVVLRIVVVAANERCSEDRGGTCISVMLLCECVVLKVTNVCVIVIAVGCWMWLWCW